MLYDYSNVQLGLFISYFHYQGVMVPPVNDPIMLDIPIWLFGYIYYQNPSIISDFIETTF